MNNYELLYILPSGMTGIEIKSVFEEIEKEIKGLGGEKLETLLDHPFLLKTEISKEEGSEELKNLPVIKRKLAYPIKKNRFGFYCLFNFKSEGANVEEINKYLKANSRILRHLLLQADPLTREGLVQLQKLFARKRAEQEKECKKEEARTAKEEREKDDQKILMEKEEVIRKKIEKEKAAPSAGKEGEKKDEEKTLVIPDSKEKEKVIIPEKEAGKKKAEETGVKRETAEKEEKETAKEQPKEKKTTAKKKKKIKLEDLEDKLDEILEDTMI